MADEQPAELPAEAFSVGDTADASTAEPDTRVSVPGQPAGPRTEGWYRSPSGVLTHADGPSQVRAYVDRGYTPVDEDEAKAEIGGGIRLEADDNDGAFDADAVRQAVKDEATRPQPRRNRGIS